MLECCRVGLQLRELFENLGIQMFAKTSGKKGLQLTCRSLPRCHLRATKAFAKAVAETLESAEPELVVSRMTRRGARARC